MSCQDQIELAKLCRLEKECHCSLCVSPYSPITNHTIDFAGTNDMIFFIFLSCVYVLISSHLCVCVTLYRSSLWCGPLTHRAIYMSLYMCVSPAICLFHYSDHIILCDYYVSTTYVILIICLYFRNITVRVSRGDHILWCGSSILLATPTL